ncbi:cupin domain-containing protein [Stackebrandtia nassauensis]|uniref:Cupin 2 conserved barrel domain protein n=1 Tax=Stackebrandtia nassauensis (strain DSM 44728 / CIP 108903 / NRRL B-16338 / NBRC 102104 / LLR-40K-21) TaxID=446470 RepID=D3Q8H9_STANL|nr:cupin domain-containing protein [Stackebrandtia nassauensis]ADD42553.1 Cupin 2 conserved barrel domain protein [Stackebrandtia nassauensis DSM 44728]
MSDYPKPVLVRAAEAETLQDGPTSLLTLLADSDTTGDAMTVNRATLSDGSPGAPPHFHTRAAEAFFIIDGAMRMLLGDTITTLHKGDFLVVPSMLPHAFAPVPGGSADALVVFSPGMARFDYYRLLERVFKGMSDISEIAASSGRYDNHYCDSPVWREALT